MKIDWKGVLISVQPRFKLGRAFDQRQHGYPGYALLVRGEIDGQAGTAWFGVGKAAHEKHQFQVGQVVAGKAAPVADSRTEVVAYYKVSGLRVTPAADSPSPDAPPWQGPPPSIEVYRERRHRRLDESRYAGPACSVCVWGAKMPVEITMGRSKPALVEHRTETFCYGPKSCSFYDPGPTRVVPGPGGATFEEEDSVDQLETSHRGLDD